MFLEVVLFVPMLFWNLGEIPKLFKEDFAFIDILLGHYSNNDVENNLLDKTIEKIFVRLFNNDLLKHIVSNRLMQLMADDIEQYKAVAKLLVRVNVFNLKHVSFFCKGLPFHFF